MKPPPAQRPGIVKTLFGDVTAAALTAATVAILVALLPALDWAFVSAIWTTDDPMRCNGAGGACWAFVAAKLRLILFGLYPPEEQWRPMAVITLVVVLSLATLPPRFWGRNLAIAWLAGIAACLALMWGGFLGLKPVSTANWGGLPVTLLLAVLSLGIGFPIAVVLAFGRRSTAPVTRIVSVFAIEIVRGMPLVALLFVTSIMLPLLLPGGWTIDKLGRTMAALTIFAAAYLAEVVRGGLQGVAQGQIEAARALGLPIWLTIWHVVLPQAIQKVIPPLTNTAIVMVKNTSLVLIVGIFDMLSAGRAAATDPRWPAPYAESYVFVGAVYFAVCFGISLYSRWLEQQAQAKSYR
jgi:general L-amino acid transport system permease protein